MQFTKKSEYMFVRLHSMHQIKVEHSLIISLVYIFSSSRFNFYFLKENICETSVLMIS